MTRSRFRRHLSPLAFAPVLFCPLEASAQAESGETRSLEEVVVTASGFEQELKEAPASMSVVTRQDLETRNYRDLAEALQDVEGIDVRGSQVAMIFQEPMTSLNPVHTVGFQITEAMRAHDARASNAELRDRAIEALKRVRIPAPERRFDEYPHQLSGGMRQRVMIAMALACRPKLLIADEPTTALDVTVQAQILDLLRELQEETGMSIILITHDLGVVAEMADEVAVMYAGRVVERAPAGALFGDPMHPYTLGLLGSVPRLDEERETLLAIDGSVPPPFALPKGCRFHPRCPFAVAACKDEQPPLRMVADGHQAACIRAPVEAFAA